MFFGSLGVMQLFLWEVADIVHELVMLLLFLYCLRNRKEFEDKKRTVLFLQRNRNHQKKMET